MAPNLSMLLFESASGYGLFDVVETDEIGLELEVVQKTVLDLSKFGKVVKLKAFLPFTSAMEALENINNISEGMVSPALKHFLQMNVPQVKPGKKAKFSVGVHDAKIGSAILEELAIPCQANQLTAELLRGVRLHFDKFVKALRENDLQKAQLGLGHSYSRAKVKFNVNRVDNMIIQAIALLDQLDKDINTFSMRVREWYSWHFPELVKIVNDNYLFARLVVLIRNKSTLNDESVEKLEEVLMDSGKARAVVDASKASMGTDISEIDLINIEAFAKRVVSLSDYRKKLHTYLQHKMAAVAPNLSALIGEAVGARLISHAGSLTNLAKYPASTVQILGAEKALFRALKTRGNTPKYGLIFHSSFIGKAGAKNKGRISRYLANKCSIASRIDCFSDALTTKFGEAMRAQVEERLSFYETGEAPAKNIDTMHKVMTELQAGEKKKGGKKRKAGEEEEEAAAAGAEPTTPSGEKKKKKAKKAKVDGEADAMDTAPDTPSSEKKKKKNKNKEAAAADPETPSSEKKKKKKKDA